MLLSVCLDSMPVLLCHTFKSRVAVIELKNGSWILCKRTVNGSWIVRKRTVFPDVFRGRFDPRKNESLRRLVMLVE